MSVLAVGHGIIKQKLRSPVCVPLFLERTGNKSRSSRDPLATRVFRNALGKFGIPCHEERPSSFVPRWRFVPTWVEISRRDRYVSR